MSVSELPTASAVCDVLASRGANRLSEMGDDSVSVSSVEEVDIAAVLAAAKSLSASELFKVIKECTKEAEKRMKTVEKSTPAKRQAKKAKDAPKKKTPHQLRKNNAWVTFTREHARKNGWESFTVKHEIKDSDKKTIGEEVVEMPASVLHDGAYIYEDSVTEKTPDGRQIIHKEAMSLSKQRKGTHPSWDEFLASYEEEAASETESVAKSTTSSKVTVRKTAAEKEAERAEKAAAKEAEKAEKAAEREAKKAATAAKKAAEDAAKAERKAEREAKKAEKEAEAAKAKASKKVPAKKAAAKEAPVKAATVSLKTASAPKAAAPKAAGGAGAVARRPVVEEEWVAPKEEGAVKAWSYKGRMYLRNAENEIWLKAADGGIGEWQGVYVAAENRIDDSIPEPVFDEE